MDNWKNILDEDILKNNINFAAVFVMNYECLREFIVERIRDFYSEHFYMDGIDCIINNLIMEGLK